MAYVDDLNAVIPYKDCLFFFQTFESLTKEIGLRIRPNKSKILTSTNCTSPIDYITPEQKVILNESLRKYTFTNKYPQGIETTDGITILGYPLGCKTYINNKLDSIHEEVTNTINSIQASIEDIQTIGPLINNCLLSKYHYTLCTDVLYNETQCSEIYNYDSHHIAKIQDIITDLCKFLAAIDDIPPFLMELVSRPTSQNGTHIINLTKSAISLACTPVLRSIQMVKFGIK